MLHGLPSTLKRLGLSQVDFAKGVRRRQETVSRWVHGHVVPSGESVTAMLAYLRTVDPKVTYEELSGAQGEQIPLPIYDGRRKSPLATGTAS